MAYTGLVLDVTYLFVEGWALYCEEETVGFSYNWASFEFNTIPGRIALFLS